MLVPMCTVPESIVLGNICNAKDQGTFNVPLQRDHDPYRKAPVVIGLLSKERSVS